MFDFKQFKHKYNETEEVCPLVSNVHIVIE